MYGVLHANLALLTRPEEVHPAQRPLGLFLQSKDVMGKNVAIYQGQASAKRQLAKKDVKIVVVANPSRLPPSRRRSIPPKGPLASSCSPEAQRAAAAQTNPQQMGRGAGMGGGGLPAKAGAPDLTAIVINSSGSEFPSASLSSVRT